MSPGWLCRVYGVAIHDPKGLRLTVSDACCILSSVGNTPQVLVARCLMKTPQIPVDCLDWWRVSANPSPVAPPVFKTGGGLHCASRGGFDSHPLPHPSHCQAVENAAEPLASLETDNKRAELMVTGIRNRDRPSRLRKVRG